MKIEDFIALIFLIDGLSGSLSFFFVGFLIIGLALRRLFRVMKMEGCGRLRLIGDSLLVSLTKALVTVDTEAPKDVSVFTEVSPFVLASEVEGTVGVEAEVEDVDCVVVGAALAAFLTAACVDIVLNCVGFLYGLCEAI